MDAVKVQREFVKAGVVKNFYTTENQKIRRVVPEGYMTGEEFVKQGIENIDKFCKEHGLL